MALVALDRLLATSLCACGERLRPVSTSSSWPLSVITNFLASRNAVCSRTPHKHTHGAHAVRIPLPAAAKHGVHYLEIGLGSARHP